MSWRESAYAHIDSHFRRIMAERPELNIDEILKIISRDRYPFGMRQYHPYQQWLKAIKDYRNTANTLWPAKSGKGVAKKIDGPLFSGVRKEA